MPRAISLTRVMILCSVLIGCGRSPTDLLQEVPSPDGSLVVLGLVNQDKTDPTRYLCVIVEVRDTAGDVLYREVTPASDIQRWSLRWTRDDEILLDSSDVGRYYIRPDATGEWHGTFDPAPSAADVEASANPPSTVPSSTMPAPGPTTSPSGDQVMPEETSSTDDRWEQTEEARRTALAGVLGEPAADVLHSMVPFHLGGSADVLIFPTFIQGVTYVTADLTGDDTDQLPTSLGNYVLMICMRQPLPRAGELISNLAMYTRDARLEPGDTMDLRSFFGDSTIRALLFTHPGDAPVRFEFLGRQYGLLLCLGITADELELARSKGSDQLLTRLKEQGVFPCTVPGRASVLAPASE